jgi:hypothetical protein
MRLLDRFFKFIITRSMRLLDRFSKFIITARLPLRRMHTDHHHLQDVVIQTEWHFYALIIIREQEATHDLFITIMSFILNIMTCVYA